jgi:hypothetical protein
VSAMPNIFEESAFPPPWDHRLSLGIKHEVLANASGIRYSFATAGLILIGAK